MRLLLVLLAYLAAAASGLAAGYYASASDASPRAGVPARDAEALAGFAEMEAAAAFLETEERRSLTSTSSASAF